jgi:hypothetical protein
LVSDVGEQGMKYINSFTSIYTVDWNLMWEYKE